MSIQPNSVAAQQWFNILYHPWVASAPQKHRHEQNGSRMSSGGRSPNVTRPSHDDSACIRRSMPAERQCRESATVLPSIPAASPQSCRLYSDVRLLQQATRHFFAIMPFSTGESPMKRKQNQFGNAIGVLPGVPPQHAAADSTTTAAPVSNILSEIIEMLALA